MGIYRDDDGVSVGRNRRTLVRAKLIGQTLVPEKRPVVAEFLRSIGLSNGCTVKGGVHSVIVVGDLLRRYCLMVVRRKLQTSGESEERRYI